MKEINPHTFSNNLLETFRKYLLSLVPINDPDIHKLYADALSDGSYKIFKGPFIHCPPQYEKSSTPRELMNSKNAPFLDNRLLLCNPNSFDPDLSLYTHQVGALKRIQEGRNVVISTGTGSGKTEGFLYPILHDALQNPSYGVRSVVIYPMNALANDQLERLRKLLDTNQDITFGRYTGETLDDRDEVAKTDTHNPMLPNERLSREDIRARPPHILLTNFAMLEYLLLRPVDSDIFSQKKVKYIILDEAHTYTGAQGIDISMLLRRFSSRFKNNKIQFILTSATISENIKDVACFASDLCGVEFHDKDIITGNERHKFKPRTIPAEQLNNHKDQFNDESYLDTWCKAFDNKSALKDMLKLSKLFPDYSEDEPVYKTLYKNLHRNEVLYKIFMLCREKPRTIDEIANEIYGSVDVASRNSVAWFLMVGAHARQTRESAPLMQVKFHYFLRGLTGSSICINKDCSGMNTTSSSSIGKALFLEERERCNLCNSKVFQLSCCTHCGMPAFKVYIQDNKWQIVKPGGTPVAEVLSIGVHSDDVEIDNVPDAGSHMNRKLCLNCGYFSEKDELYDCCDDMNVITLRALGSDENGDIRTCPQCSGRAGKFNSVLRTFRTGDEAPTSVIAESVLRNLPIINRDKPAGARSLIAFSDSRQRAAFLLPIFQEPYLIWRLDSPLSTL